MAVIRAMCAFPWKQLLCILPLSPASESVLSSSVLIMIVVVLISPFSLIVYFDQSTQVQCE